MKAFINKHFSIIFAIAIFAGLSCYASQAEAQEIAPALTGAETALVLRDSDNAHKVATAALGAVGCILESLSGNAEWTPQECAERLEVILKDYGQEHKLLHPTVLRMLKEALERRTS
jgi:hypothetical protein